MPRVNSSKIEFAIRVEAVLALQLARAAGGLTSLDLPMLSVVVLGTP